MVRANPRADAPARAADYPFAVGGEPFIPAALPVVAAETETQMAVFTYNVGIGARIAVQGEVVAADGQARAVPLTVVKVSDVERGGGRKVMLTWKPEGLAPGRYVMKVAVSGAGQSSAAFEVR